MILTFAVFFLQSTSSDVKTENLTLKLFLKDFDLLKNGLTKNKKLGLMTLIFKIFGNFTIKNMKKFEKRITFF